MRVLGWDISILKLELLHGFVYEVDAVVDNGCEALIMDSD